jgi:UDP-N-acetyl-D-glucosamine dehydrogenase
MPYHCVSKIERVLNGVGRAVNGSRIAVLGVSYKPGVGDTRESPALKIMALLRGLGAELRYHDPHVDALGDLALESEALPDALHEADLAVIVTAHPEVDHEHVASLVPLVVDLRGVVRRQAVAHGRSQPANVVRL